MIDSYEKYRQVAKYAGGYFEEQFLELIDRLEAAESARRDDYQNWMAALDRNAELLAKLEAAEKERDALRAETKSLREGLKRMCLDEDANAKEANTLRAKIAEMEKQEPVAWMLNCPTLGGDTGWILSWTQSGAGLCNRLQGEENEKRLYALPGAQPAPSINEGVRKVTLDFRWESEAQHHIPTIEIEFEPVSPDSPNDAKGWQDRDRIAAMLTPEAKP